MDLTDGRRFRAVLTTVGRRTGRRHSVELLAVALGGRAYFTRHRPDSDWFLNARACPDVAVADGGEELAGSAAEVSDPALAAEVSALKYPGQARAAEPRVAIGVTLCGPASSHRAGRSPDRPPSRTP